MIVYVAKFEDYENSEFYVSVFATEELAVKDVCSAIDNDLTDNWTDGLDWTYEEGEDIARLIRSRFISDNKLGINMFNDACDTHALGRAYFVSSRELIGYPVSNIGVLLPEVVVSPPTSSECAEKPCKVCGKKNDLGVKKCWNCETLSP